jgi:hypothetical protein
LFWSSKFSAKCSTTVVCGFAFGTHLGTHGTRGIPAGIPMNPRLQKTAEWQMVKVIWTHDWNWLNTNCIISHQWLL